MSIRRAAVGKHRRRTACRPPLLLLSFVIGFTGCLSGQHATYISPRITGRVLAADTGRPLAGVAVRRLRPGQKPAVDQSLKGGQAMELMRPAWSDADGRFVVPAERDLNLFASASSWSVTVYFEKSGFESFRTNYTLSQRSGYSSAGEPLVDGGDILLRPAAR